jgi:hypothetical protein
MKFQRCRAPASRLFFALLAPLPWVLVACSNDDAVLGVVGDNQGSTVSLARDIQPIFSASCAVAFCHGSPLAAPMSLLSSDTHISLVGAVSCEASPLLRVEAGSSATSYLTIKLEGTQSAVLSAGGCITCNLGSLIVGDCGGRMPLGGPYLSDAEIQRIRDWIDQGAQNN